MPPFIVTHLCHIVVVLRRSPASVTSSSPSPRRRGDGTLPWPQLDQEFEGRHRAERVLIAEVPYVRYLDRSDHEDVRLHQPRCANASAFDLRGYVDTLSPLVAMHLLDRSCVSVGFFFKILRSPTVVSELGLCVDVICTSRTQVSCGRYKSYCLPACHILVRRYCWMKRPGPTLRVRLRETGSTDVLCT